jgi:hypothetical protein
MMNRTQPVADELAVSLLLLRRFTMGQICLKTLAHKAVIALLAICLLMAAPAFSQTGGPYDLSWNTIDGGGGTSTGGPYMLSGTIAQPDAAYSAGGEHELLGGFWPYVPTCWSVSECAGQPSVH